MKIAIATTVLLLGSATAFAPGMQSTATDARSNTSLNASSDDNKEMSKSLPFLPRPKLLDGSMPGDVGFDPLGFATGKNELLNYREAEIKHSRLAMLAAAGWLLSEVFEKQILPMFGVPSLLDDEDRVPSLLN